jgi:hypothetical protein
VVRRWHPKKHWCWQYLVVESNEDQVGRTNERGVRIIYETDTCCNRRLDSPRAIELRAEAQRVADLGNRALDVGLNPMTPPEIIRDREMGLAVGW